MRTLISKLVAGAVFLTVAGATSANAQSIDGSAHDLEVSTEGICVYCHTPHAAQDPGSYPVPLWDRSDSSLSFDMYDSTSIEMTAKAAPEGVSMACLSCHDGATAYNALASGTLTGGAAGPMGATNAKAVGATGGAGNGKLGDDHPISINYDPTADTAFKAAVSGKVGALPLFRAVGAGGAGTQVECATCHSVHDETNVPFLRVANTGSALCTTCHSK